MVILFPCHGLLYSISHEETLYIVEGEKCADAMTKAGFLCTTANGGANSVKLSVWDRAMLDKFAAKVIIPDNDEKGQKYIELFPDCNVLNLSDIWINIKPKQDIADYIEFGHDLDLIRNYKFPELNPNLDSAWYENLTKEELISRETFERLYAVDEKFEREYMEVQLEFRASELKIVSQFKKLCKAFKHEKAKSGEKRRGNVTDFPDQPIALSCGGWTADINGVRRQKISNQGNAYDEYASTIPILPAEILENINTGVEKLRIDFHKNGWKSVICDRVTAASNAKIIELANAGIEVNSENAKLLVQYIADCVALNNDVLPRSKAVSQMGWVDSQFVPYDTQLIYAGDAAYTDIYNSVHGKGSFDEWVKMYRDVRSDNIAVRTAVATSFASPLIHVFGKLPFFTHIRGDSDTGKTVVLKLACSVWGEPDTYIRDLNSTTVGAERTAYFFHNLPYVLDELQTIKNDDTIGKLLYLLAQGQGRTRGTIRGVDTVLQWRCAMITSGEQPLTSQNSNTGEINRVIDVPVSEQIFKNPSNVYTVCHEHYGHAGRYFIEHLNEYKPREVLAKWETRLNQMNTDISGKHRMTLSLILTADELVNRMLFGMNETESEVDTIEFYQHLSKMIISISDSDLTTRAYDFVCSWVAENGDKFKTDPYGEQWGFVSGGGATVLISGRILKEVLDKHKYNYTQTLEGLAKRGLIKCGNDGKSTKPFRLNRILARGIELTLPEEI